MNQVRRTIEDFLFSEWSNGHLMGETPEEAYFVKCDRSTMTQNDSTTGVLCACRRRTAAPRGFVIFRIGQKTLESEG